MLFNFARYRGFINYLIFEAVTSVVFWLLIPELTFVLPRIPIGNGVVRLSSSVVFAVVLIIPLIQLSRWRFTHLEVLGTRIDELRLVTLCFTAHGFLVFGILSFGFVGVFQGFFQAYVALLCFGLLGVIFKFGLHSWIMPVASFLVIMNLPRRFLKQYPVLDFFDLSSKFDQHGQVEILLGVLVVELLVIWKLPASFEN